MVSKQDKKAIECMSYSSFGPRQRKFSTKLERWELSLGYKDTQDPPPLVLSEVRVGSFGTPVKSHGEEGWGESC